MVREEIFTLWFNVKKIKQLYNEIKGCASIVKDLGISEYNGTTEFVIEDNNQFMLHFSDLELT